MNAIWFILIYFVLSNLYDDDTNLLTYTFFKILQECGGIDECGSTRTSNYLAHTMEPFEVSIFYLYLSTSAKSIPFCNSPSCSGALSFCCAAVYNYSDYVCLCQLVCELVAVYILWMVPVQCLCVPYLGNIGSGSVLITIKILKQVKKSKWSHTFISSIRQKQTLYQAQYTTVVDEVFPYSG